jgi:hypothetical protein
MSKDEFYEQGRIKSSSLLKEYGIELNGAGTRISASKSNTVLMRHWVLTTIIWACVTES